MTISTAQAGPQDPGSGTLPPALSNFDVVRRGYDRNQVDRKLRDLTERLDSEMAARKAAEQHATATEDELRAIRSQHTEAPAAPDSFGFRAEKIIRLAEHEAADVRNRATAEATTLLEQARADAERHRHEVEQGLIARSAELDQEAAKRIVAIQDREQQAASTLAAARDEASRITDDARRGAESLVSDAKAKAEDVRERSEQEIARSREAAEKELRRLDSMQESVRTEMARLHQMLGSELDADGQNGRSTASNSGRVAQRHRTLRATRSPA